MFGGFRFFYHKKHNKMARNEITFQVNLKKDTNSASRAYGMYFGEAFLPLSPHPSRIVN